MVPAEVERKIDSVWDAFWAAGISNPLEVVEQISYLIFLRFLDGAHTRMAGGPAEVGELVGDPAGTQLPENLHWSHMVLQSPNRMLASIRDEAFPWLRAHYDGQSAFFRHVRDARFTIPTPGLLAKVIDLVESIPLAEKAAGVAYEYMLSKIATAGQYGQFLTPRHIIQLAVEMLAPGPDDEICDPACGTAGFLVAAADYISRTHAEALLDTTQRTHFNQSMFHGFDFDGTMLRIASMNMLLHQIENPDIRFRDSLAESVADEEGRYSLVLANPPFAGSLDYGTTTEHLQRVVKTKKTELLFLALTLELLKPGGRAAVVVPEGVLFGSTPAHKELRRLLVEDHRLDAVLKLPAGSFSPYAGISTSIVFFTKPAPAALRMSGSMMRQHMILIYIMNQTCLLPETSSVAHPEVFIAKRNLLLTTCLTFWPDGRTGTMVSSDVSVKIGASVYRRRRLWPKVMTLASVTTGKTGEGSSPIRKGGG